MPTWVIFRSQSTIICPPPPPHPNPLFFVLGPAQTSQHRSTLWRRGVEKQSRLCNMYIVHCTLYICTLLTVHCTVHCTLYTVHLGLPKTSLLSSLFYSETMTSSAIVELYCFTMLFYALLCFSMLFYAFLCSSMLTSMLFYAHPSLHLTWLSLQLVGYYALRCQVLHRECIVN